MRAQLLLLTAVATAVGFFAPPRVVSRTNGASMAAPQKKTAGPKFQSMEYWVSAARQSD